MDIAPKPLEATRAEERTSGVCVGLVCARADFARGFCGANFGSDSGWAGATAAGCEFGAADKAGPLLATVISDCGREPENSERRTRTAETSTTTATTGAHAHRNVQPRRGDAAEPASAPLDATSALASKAGEMRGTAAAGIHSCSSPTGSSTALLAKKTTSRQSAHLCQVVGNPLAFAGWKAVLHKRREGVRRRMAVASRLPGERFP